MTSRPAQGHIALAIEEAKQAAGRGEVPIGAVIASADGQIGRGGCTYQPHSEQRKTPTGMHFSFRTFALPNQDFSGAPSTQVLTMRLGPSDSKRNPCTISPLHLGHRVVAVLMSEPPNSYR